MTSGAVAALSPAAGPSRSRAQFALRAAGAVAVLVVVGIAVRLAWQHGGGPDALHDRFGWWAPAVSVLLLALTSWTFLPSEFIGIAHGSAYGFVFGVAANWAGWMLTALLQYSMVRFGVIGRVPPERLERLERLPAPLRRLPLQHPLVLVLARQLPFGSAIVNTASPGLGVSLWRHMWCAAIGLLPIAVICAAIGAGVAR